MFHAPILLLKPRPNEMAFNFFAAKRGFCVSQYEPNTPGLLGRGKGVLPDVQFAPVTEATPEAVSFDFDAHRKAAVEQYSRQQSLCRDFAEVVSDILTDAIKSRGLRVNAIQYRAKELESFGKKSITPAEQSSTEPKYRNPLADITDLAGVRVITFFPRTVDEVGQCVQAEFDVIERVDHTATAQREERLGYQSVHYLVRLGNNRNRLSEYRRFEGLVAEVQVRTVMQHAWAEIEHDIRYKSKSSIPLAAGLLEIADREFQAIQAEDASLRAAAKTLINEGRLDEVEVTADALHTYLDARLGTDDRISDYTYEWMAKILWGIGFQNLGQVHECISGLDDDKLSRTALGSRSGQVTRFEVLLVTAMGSDNYLEGHPWGEAGWYRNIVNGWVEKLRQSEVPIGSYLPEKSK
jgi:ppGpp synthetase/RelA/SpoT-type nucleotidyltranferase